MPAAACSSSQVDKVHESKAKGEGKAVYPKGVVYFVDAPYNLDAYYDDFEDDIYETIPEDEPLNYSDEI